jgi:hypothetical protein
MLPTRESLGFRLFVGEQEMSFLQTHTILVVSPIDESYPRSLCHSSLRAVIEHKDPHPVLPKSGFARFLMASASGSWAESGLVG